MVLGILLIFAGALGAFVLVGQVWGADLTVIGFILMGVGMLLLVRALVRSSVGDSGGSGGSAAPRTRPKR